MTGEDYQALTERLKGMDPELAGLCETCNIFMEGELGMVMNTVDAYGLETVLAAMKRLSTISKDPLKYPIQQFQDVLVHKLRGAQAQIDVTQNEVLQSQLEDLKQELSDAEKETDLSKFRGGDKDAVLMEIRADITGVEEKLMKGELE